MQVILISGPSGSGKTTLAKQILEKTKKSFLLSTDNYYKTGVISRFLSKLIGTYFDRKLSFNLKLFKKDFNYIIINNKSNHLYTYNFNKKTVKRSLLEVHDIKLLIIEGIFAKEVLQNIYKRKCIFIELKTKKESCMKRVIKRDVNERGKNIEMAKRDFLKSWSIYYSKNKNIYLRKNVTKLFFSDENDLNLLLKKLFNI